MKKILTISTIIFFTAACSQNSMHSNPMTPEQCMQKMQKEGMMHKHEDMMKDCPMMKHKMGNTQRTTPPVPSL